MLEQIIFIDIETVPIFHHYKEMSKEMQTLWNKKADRINPSSQDHAKTYQEKAGIYAEFGKIIVIGLGYFKKKENSLTFRMKALKNNNEKDLLEEFNQLLTDKFSSKAYRFCAHNGKEFDYPYLCRRMLINQMEIPTLLEIRGKKPWEINHLDTLELWKFGDYKHYTSLDLLCSVLNVPTSKTTIDGSKVAEKYYKENALTEIAEYCLRDVLATARVYQRLTNNSIIEEKNIHTFHLR